MWSEKFKVSLSENSVSNFILTFVWSVDGRMKTLGTKCTPLSNSPLFTGVTL